MERRSAVRGALLIGSVVLVIVACSLLLWQAWQLWHRPVVEDRADVRPTRDAGLVQEHQYQSAAGCPGTPVDLTAYYNAEAGAAIGTGSREHPNTLSALRTGEHAFADVKFSVNGMIQLGKIYPKEVKGIKVGARCQRLHLLHGTAGFEKDGTPIAGLTLHYADGSTSELAIAYGEHVRDWWAWNQYEATSLAAGTEIAWWGDNEYAHRQNVRLRLYRTTFANPKPEVMIETIDYGMRGTKCNPFLLGFSIE